MCDYSLQAKGHAMKKSVAKAWVKDLRESGAKQARGSLFDGEGYCCLGRLCIVLGYEFIANDPPEEDEPYWMVNADAQYSGVLLPLNAQDKAGMKSSSGCIDEIDLSRENDSGKTFAEIADIIEQCWERL